MARLGVGRFSLVLLLLYRWHPSQRMLLFPSLFPGFVLLEQRVDGCTDGCMDAWMAFKKVRVGWRCWIFVLLCPSQREMYSY